MSYISPVSLSSAVSYARYALRSMLYVKNTLTASSIPTYSADVGTASAVQCGATTSFRRFISEPKHQTIVMGRFRASDLAAQDLAATAATTFVYPIKFYGAARTPIFQAKKY